MMKLNIQLFGHTNETENYDLPQFVGTDKPTWLGDFNTAMSTIDTAIAENASDITSLGTRVSSAESAASQASTDVASLTSTVSTLSSDVTSATTTANNAQSTATSALNTANTADGKADTNATAISTLTDTVEGYNDDINDELYFKNGDTLSFDDYTTVAGIITGSNKSLTFTIVLPKSVKNINTITLSSTFKVDIRIPSGGYATGASGVNIGGAGYTKTVTKVSENMVDVTVNASANWTNTNNIPVGVSIQSGAYLTFTTTGN